MQVRKGFGAGQLAMACWRKSVHSNPTGNCVEVAKLPARAIAVRNSRYPSGTVLIFERAEIAAFLKRVKTGDFDDFCRDASATALPRGRG